MNCFVFNVVVDGVWGVGQSLLLFGAWTSGRRPCSGLGDTARRRCRRGPRRHRRRPALRMRAALNCFFNP